MHGHFVKLSFSLGKAREFFTNARTTFRRIFQFARPYRRLFYFGIAGMMVSSSLGLIFPYLTGSLIDSAQGNSSAVNNLFANINRIAVVLLICLGVQAAITYLHGVALARVGQRTLADVRSETFSRLIRFRMTFFATRRVGELTSRIAVDLSQIENTLINVVPQLLNQSINLTGGVVLILITSLKLSLFMLCIVPPLIILALLLGKRIHRLAKEAQDRLAESNTIVEECLQGIMTVKAFANEGFERNRYQKSLDRFLQIVFRNAKFQSAFVSFIIFVMFGAIVVVLWYGTRLLERHELTTGQLTRFLIYTMYVGGAIGHYAGLYNQIRATLGATERVFELFNEIPESDPQPKQSLPRLRGDVALNNVTFRYPSRAESVVLQNVSFSVAAGQKLALVGPSGAGKSTLINLLLRLYEPESGTIEIDGKNAAHYPLVPLRDQTAIVPQEVLLFGGTIAENIAYGKPDATRPEIEAAARKAHAHEFISQFPEGYETKVGERGAQLSGGQRQRVAIARAILKNPAILILDEATSSLDSESERLIHDALEELMKGRTTFIIAHRLSTVRTADQIVVLKNGAVVETGTHESLQKVDGGLYRRLSELQWDIKE